VFHGIKMTIKNHGAPDISPIPGISLPPAPALPLSLNIVIINLYNISRAHVYMKINNYILFIMVVDSGLNFGRLMSPFMDTLIFKILNVIF